MSEIMFSTETDMINMFSILSIILLICIVVFQLMKYYSLINSQIESLFEIREFKDAVIEFSMEMKDMESPEQQLKIQKDTGSIYRESYKKKK